MSDRIRVAAIGAVIEIDASTRGPAFALRVREAWADALLPRVASADAVVPARQGIDDDAALALLSSDVTLAALAVRRGDPLWMMHAAGLADAHGRVVVLSAPSGTGKTTAARHLSRRSAYVSDETVGVAGDGRVVPYRKPLSIIEPGSAHKVQVAPSHLHGDTPLAEDLRVAAIVVLDRAPDGPAQPAVERLDPAAALELLAPQTSYLSDVPAPLHLIRDVLAGVGGALRIRYREAETLDAVIAELLAAAPLPSSPAASSVEREVAGAADGAAAGAADDAGAREDATESDAARGGIRRAPVVDSLDLGDGRLALLRRSASGSSVHVLDGIGPAVWHAADGRTLDEVTAAVVAVHGQPGDADARALVASAVEALCADDLLTHAPDQT